MKQVDLRFHSAPVCKCPSYYELFTKVGVDGQDTCKGDEGGPLITEENDGSFTLVGILSGGGLDCSRLNDPNYDWQNKTELWMRIGSFEQWIQSMILSEEEPTPSTALTTTPTTRTTSRTTKR